LSAAEQNQIKLEKVKQFAAVAGHGVMATINERRVLFGNKALMDEQGLSIRALTIGWRNCRFWETPMLLAVDNKLPLLPFPIRLKRIRHKRYKC
jgi:Cu+-exporting ATPase